MHFPGLYCEECCVSLSHTHSLTLSHEGLGNQAEQDMEPTSKVRWRRGIGTTTRQWVLLSVVRACGEREREREVGEGGGLGREGVMQWGWSGRPLKHSVSLFSQISNLGSPRRTNGAFHTQYCRRLFDSERPLDSKLAPLPYNNLYKSSQVKSSQIKNPESPGNAYIAAHVS